MKPLDYIYAARVPASLKPQTFGPWKIERANLSNSLAAMARAGFSSYTLLFRTSWAALQLKVSSELVMEDSLHELQTHLPIWLRGRGRVLVTGLGLGCVVRGLLANTDVDQIDVIELDKSIIRVIGHEFASNPRVKMYNGDALTYHIPHGERYDCAWHDLWTDGDDHLQVLHARLLSRFCTRATEQGAWALPRPMKRSFGRYIPIIG